MTTDLYKSHGNEPPSPAKSEQNNHLANSPFTDHEVEMASSWDLASGGGDQHRNTADFKPGMWGDHFLQYDSNSYSLDSHLSDLIARVKAMLTDDDAGDDTLAMLNLINHLQRFGIAYHFEVEINSCLAKLSESYPDLVEARDGDDDLCMVSLLFRLLRQHGYYVSSDVFNKFKDAATRKFRQSLAGNLLGIVSLFEASHMLVRQESVLEEALAFTIAHLESIDEKRESPFIVKLARQALKQPIRQGYPRVEAWRYIRIYQDDISCNETVLTLAKLDFNSLQKLHQKEACDVVRWWKDGDFASNLPFARDRTIEMYLWVLAIYFEPEFSFARIFIAKIDIMISLMDDMFDAYGKLIELELFVEALERWEISAMDGLPEYMKFYYKALMDVYDKIEEEMASRGHSYRLDYAKHSMKDLAKAYLTEVKWFHRKYIPTMDEYIAIASESIAVKAAVFHTLVGMGDVVTEDTFMWLSGNPHVLHSASSASRFLDDIVGHKFEHERGHVASSIHCVVKQYGCTEQEAEEMLRKWVFDCWKDANEACLRPLSMPMTVLERILNWFRSMSVIYDDGIDNYTQSSTMLKDVVTDVLVNPLPL